MGRDRLQSLIVNAGFPVISANIEDATSHALFTNPHAIVTENDGLRIGILGLTLESAAKSVFPENIRGLAFRDRLLALGVQQVRIDREGNLQEGFDASRLHQPISGNLQQHEHAHTSLVD